MKTFNITTSIVKETIKVVGGIALYGVALAKSCDTAKNVFDLVRCNVNAKYSDAVDVIASSNMLDSHKNEALELLKKDKDSEYYKSIIRIIKSNMLGSNKVTAISNLGKEEED